jgi:hypothetical protein
MSTFGLVGRVRRAYYSAWREPKAFTKKRLEWTSDYADAISHPVWAEEGKKNTKRVVLSLFPPKSTFQIQENPGFHAAMQGQD